jgi:hypothetical protein
MLLEHSINVAGTTSQKIIYLGARSVNDSTPMSSPVKPQTADARTKG